MNAVGLERKSRVRNIFLAFCFFVLLFFVMLWSITISLTKSSAEILAQINNSTKINPVNKDTSVTCNRVNKNTFAISTTYGIYGNNYTTHTLPFDITNVDTKANFRFDTNKARLPYGLAVDINNNFVINPRIDGVIKYCQADNYEITLPYNVYYSEKLIGSYNVNILLQVKRRHVTQVNYLGTLYPFVFDIVDFANEKLINGAELTLPYGYTSSNSAHRFETTFSYLPDYTIGSDIIYWTYTNKTLTTEIWDNYLERNVSDGTVWIKHGYLCPNNNPVSGEMQVVASLISTKNYTINGSAASSSNTFDINFLRDEYDFYLNSSLFEPITTGTAINTSITFNYYETLDEYPDVTSFTIIDSDAGDYVSIAAGDTDYTYKLVISRNIPVGEYHFKFKSRSLLPDGRLVEHTHGPYELDGRTKSNYTLIVTSA